MILIEELIRTLNIVMFLIVSTLSGKSMALVYLQWSPLKTPND